MKLEIRNMIGTRKILVLVINSSGTIYQIYRVVPRNNRAVNDNAAKIIDVREDDIVVEYGIKYDFKTKQPLHLMHLVHYPKTANYMDAIARAKRIVSEYLNEQIKRGVDIYSLLG
jgi:hypothetical protein